LFFFRKTEIPPNKVPPLKGLSNLHGQVVNSPFCPARPFYPKEAAMADTKTTSATAAAQRVGRHPQTVRQWCAKRNFGVLVGGRWEIPSENVERIERALKHADGNRVLRCSSKPPL
jgi:hypothetical protein